MTSMEGKLRPVIGIRFAAAAAAFAFLPAGFAPARGGEATGPAPLEIVEEGDVVYRRGGDAELKLDLDRHLKGRRIDRL
jgi:hypothetical protein